MSCFGNLAQGAAEVQMPDESNSGVVMHPKSKYERVVSRRPHCPSRTAAGEGCANALIAADCSSPIRYPAIRPWLGWDRMQFPHLRPRPYRAGKTARHRRRGDRMIGRREFITLLGGA